MPKINPKRSSLGGDVPGMTKTDPDLGSGRPIPVAGASYDAGYDVGSVDDIQDKSMPDATMADLKRGYSTYGRAIGDRRDMKRGY